MQELRRLMHENVNVITSISGFIELAIEESDPTTRFLYLMRARKEVRRAIKLAERMREEVEVQIHRNGDE